MTETFVNHCIKMYEALSERAIDKELESGQIARVFAGRYTDVWKATKIPQTYYTPIRRSLEKHNAIQILQKGSKSIDTVIVLHPLPDAWTVDGWRDDSDLTNRTSYAMLASAVTEIRKSLGGINVVKALMQIEERLKILESEVKSLKSNFPDKYKQ